MIPENIDTIKIKPKSENLKQSFWSKSINAMRNKYLQVAIGVGTTATLAYSNFNKAPEMTTNPTIITPPKVENVETKVKTQVKKPEITITNESVSKGKLMKITEITTKGLKGEVNEDKFNPKSLVDILKTFNLDSDQTFQRLLERYGAQELINKGVIKLTRTKGPGENKIQFEIKLTNTSLEFTQQKTPEIKTAQTIQYDSINKKIVV
jgi:hypothetical protein